MPVEYLTPRIEDRALEIQSMLAARGQHRAPAIADLLIAATAELAELAVLHFDKDFEHRGAHRSARRTSRRRLTIEPAAEHTRG